MLLGSELYRNPRLNFNWDLTSYSLQVNSYEFHYVDGRRTKNTTEPIPRISEKDPGRLAMRWQAKLKKN